MTNYLFAHQGGIAARAVIGTPREICKPIRKLLILRLMGIIVNNDANKVQEFFVPTN